jgi:methyltransferase (TIGR00027 family)
VRRASHPRAGVSCGRDTRARRGPARPPDTNPRRHRPAAVSPFAEDDAASTGGNEPDSPALDRAKRALAWRASSRAAAADAAATRCPDLDVYTEALLATLGEDWRARAPDQEGAAAEGFSSAGISTALDHLAFERLQALMEKFEVSKAVEVFGTMRQVVVTGAGADTRGFRVPWPRGTAVFELAHEDVHAFAHKTLKAVGAKPAKGSSHRRVRCDPTASDYRYGDAEEALVRAGYAPDVPSVWVLQDVGSVDIGKWNDLVEEIGDLMCAGSEIVAHAPSLGPASSSLILTEDFRSSSGTKTRDAFGAELVRGMAAAGTLARAYTAGELGCEEVDGGALVGQVGVVHGVKQRPSRQETEFYREQVWQIENEDGDEEGFSF